MALGSALALYRVPLPWSEAMLSLSLVTGGLAVAARARTAVSLGALLCGGFALFHGHAHGAELPLEAEAARYVVGFCLATALLHGAGVAATVSLSRTRAQWLPRLSGAAVAATAWEMRHDHRRTGPVLQARRPGFPQLDRLPVPGHGGAEQLLRSSPQPRTAIDLSLVNPGLD
jgi:hypothetical protein